MTFLIVFFVFLVVVMMSSKFTFGQSEGWVRRVLDINAITYKVDPELLKAVAWIESRHKPRAYNPEGFKPPSGAEAPGAEIPQGFDLTGFQGSFGLCQIMHSDGWSTARAYGRPGADYPTDLMDPDHNAEIAAKYLSDLKTKGFGFPLQVDVYNLGETKYSEGKRNPGYVNDVVIALEKMRGN